MIAAMFLAVVFLLAPPPDIPWGGNDFVQYYVATDLLLSGQNPYDRTLAEARQKALGRDAGVATYAPPWALLPALPLAGLPFRQAVVANAVLNTLLLIVCAAAWANLLFPARPRLVPWVLVALPLWMPCLAVIGIGQLSLWPLAGFTGWLWLTVRRRHVPAALALVLLLVKPHLGLLPGFFVAGRWLRRRQLTTIILFLAALVGVTALTLWLRPTVWDDYFAGLVAGTPPTQIKSATLDGWARENLGQWFGKLSWTIWVTSLWAAGVAGWFSAVRYRIGLPKDQVIPFAALACAAAVATVPYAFSFDFVFLLPGFLLAVGRMLTNAPQWRWGVLAWLALEGWMVAGKLAPWEEAAYWFVPWLGLATTAWLVALHRRGPRN